MKQSASSTRLTFGQISVKNKSTLKLSKKGDDVYEKLHYVN